jgi:hypothetical protein
MYMTHTFARRETLSRAHSWLTQLGFHPRQIGAQGYGAPRIVIEDQPERLAAAKMLINAAENADPNGFTSFWDTAPWPRDVPKQSQESMTAEWREPRSSVIGWHPLD